MAKQKKELPKQAVIDHTTHGHAPVVEPPKKTRVRSPWSTRAIKTVEQAIKAVVRIGHQCPGVGRLTPLAAEPLAALLAALADVDTTFSPVKNLSGAWAAGTKVKIKAEVLAELLPLIQHDEARAFEAVWSVMVVNGRQALIGHPAGDMLPVKTSAITLS